MVLLSKLMSLVTLKKRGRDLTKQAQAKAMASRTADYTNALSTLSQVTATLTTLLFGFVSAYYLFLQDRSTQYKDRIAQSRSEIRDSLRQFHREWPNSFSHLPDTLVQGYREVSASTNETLPRASVIAELVEDLCRAPYRIEREVRHGGAPIRHWKAACYVQLLGEIAQLMTVRADSLEPVGVFPTGSAEIGFDEWREDFNSLREAVTLIPSLTKDMEKEIDAYTGTLPDGIAPTKKALFAQATFRNEVLKAQPMLLTEWNRLQEKVDDISKQDALLSEYRFSDRVDLVLLGLFGSLSTLFGVVVPLLMLTKSRAGMNPSIVKGTMITTLLFTGLSFAEFGTSVMGAPKPNWRLYLVGRWYAPICHRLGDRDYLTNDGWVLQTGYIADALASPEAERFPPPVTKALLKYASEVNAYNDRALALSAKLAESLKRHIFAAAYPDVHGRVLSLRPAQFVDASTFEKALSEIKDLEGESSLVVDISMPSSQEADTWVALCGPKNQLLMYIAELEKGLADEDEARAFLEARDSLRQAARQLRETLTAEVQSVGGSVAQVDRSESRKGDPKR
jgi:hypothetical protein